MTPWSCWGPIKPLSWWSNGQERPKSVAGACQETWTVRACNRSMPRTFRMATASSRLTNATSSGTELRCTTKAWYGIHWDHHWSMPLQWQLSNSTPERYDIILQVSFILLPCAYCAGVATGEGYTAMDVPRFCWYGGRWNTKSKTIQFP